MATQQEFADHIGVSQQTVAALIRDGKIPRGNGRSGLKIDESRLAYCAHLREVAAGRLGEGDGELDLVEQRARLAKAQADAQVMKNHLFEGKVVWHADVTAFITPLFLEIRNKCLELPSKLAPNLARLTRPGEVYAALDEQIRETLQAIADDAAPLAVARKRSMGDPRAADALLDPEEGPQETPAPVSTLKRQRRHAAASRRV